MHDLDGRARDELGRLLPLASEVPPAASPEAKLDHICSRWGVLATEEEVQSIPHEGDRAEAHLLRLQAARDEKARRVQARRADALMHAQQVRVALARARFERLKEAVRVALLADSTQSRAKLACSLGCSRTTLQGGSQCAAPRECLRGTIVDDEARGSRSRCRSARTGRRSGERIGFRLDHEWDELDRN